MLGYGTTPPTPWRPCCWTTDKNASCPDLCPSLSCEFSWLSPVMPRRLVALIGELASMYARQGVVGVELNYMRDVNYFPDATAQADRDRIMLAFVRDVRAAMDGATKRLGKPPLALGLQLSPDWANIRRQGLGDLAKLVAPTSAGGGGVTYFNWGVTSRSVYPFDCDLASLAAATPKGTPWFFQIQSWTGRSSQ